MECFEHSWARVSNLLCKEYEKRNLNRRESSHHVLEAPSKIVIIKLLPVSYYAVLIGYVWACLSQAVTFWLHKRQTYNPLMRCNVHGKFYNFCTLHSYMYHSQCHPSVLLCKYRLEHHDEWRNTTLLSPYLSLRYSCNWEWCRGYSCLFYYPAIKARIATIFCVLKHLKIKVTYCTVSYTIGHR